MFGLLYALLLMITLFLLVAIVAICSSFSAVRAENRNSRAFCPNGSSV